MDKEGGGGGGGGEGGEGGGVEVKVIILKVDCTC